VDRHGRQGLGHHLLGDPSNLQSAPSGRSDVYPFLPADLMPQPLSAVRFLVSARCVSRGYAKGRGRFPGPVATDLTVTQTLNDSTVSVQSLSVNVVLQQVSHCTWIVYLPGASGPKERWTACISL
jgi:hypothetical protein